MSDIYIEIIKRQQELINLMIKAKIYDSETEHNTLYDCKAISTASTDINMKCDVKGFAKYLESKGSSQNCIDTYTKQVELFYKKYKHLNNETLSKYETDFKNVSPKTANLRIAAMKKYFKFIGFTDYEFKRVKEQKRTFCDNAINQEQYNKLLRWAKTNNQKVYLIAKVIGNTGVRVSELIKLKSSDLEKGYADIIGKGGKHRRIYFPESLIKDIKDICGSEYIVENRQKKQITTRGVSGILKNAGQKAGLPKEVMHPHSFRHFFAKQFLKEKNDITLLGDLLGHSDVSTTAIYTRLTSEEQQKELNEIINW